MRCARPRFRGAGCGRRVWTALLLQMPLCRTAAGRPCPRRFQTTPSTRLEQRSTRRAAFHSFRENTRHSRGLDWRRCGLPEPRERLPRALVDILPGDGLLISAAKLTGVHCRAGSWNSSRSGRRVRSFQRTGRKVGRATPPLCSQGAPEISPLTPARSRDRDRDTRAGRGAGERLVERDRALPAEECLRPHDVGPAAEDCRSPAVSGRQSRMKAPAAASIVSARARMVSRRLSREERGRYRRSGFP